MKKENQTKRENMFEVVMPIGEGIQEISEGGLFDDCPVCQELRRLIQAGELQPMEEETLNE